MRQSIIQFAAEIPTEFPGCFHSEQSNSAIYPPLPNNHPPTCLHTNTHTHTLFSPVVDVLAKTSPAICCSRWAIIWPPLTRRATGQNHMQLLRSLLNEFSPNFNWVTFNCTPAADPVGKKRVFYQTVAACCVLSYCWVNWKQWFQLSVDCTFAQRKITKRTFRIRIKHLCIFQLARISC